MKIDTEDIKLCYAFADECWMYFQNQDRNKQQVIDHVAIGKLSEIYAAKMYQEQEQIVTSGPSFEITKKPDPGYDIIVRTTKINVKFLFKEDVETTHTQVGIKYDYDKKGGCEEYCLMILDKGLSDIEYYGSVKISDITHPENIPWRQNADDSYTQYLNINLFKPKLI